NFETLGRFDVLQIDAAERRLQQLTGSNNFLRIFGGKLNIEDVEVGETLEEHRLPFHHGLACSGPDVAQTQDRRAVGNDGHQVSLRRVFIDRIRVAINLKAG